MSVMDFAKRRSPPQPLDDGPPIPKNLRRDAGLEGLGAAAQAARNGDPANVRRDNMEQITALIDKALGECATQLTETGREVTAAFERLSTAAVTSTTDARSMVDDAGAKAKQLIGECNAAVAHITNASQGHRARLGDFVHAWRAATESVLRAKAAFGIPAPARDDQEIAAEMAHDLLARIERVAPGAPLAGKLRALLADPKLAQFAPEECPGHVASHDDPKVCGRCGIHIDELGAGAAAAPA
jgi:hypothetical protein